MVELPGLVATCWTSAGNVAPLEKSERSPFDPLDRIREIAATGWAGFGFVQDDLRYVEDSIGFAELASTAHSLGLTHAEVEIVGGWWESEDNWRETWDLLLRAAKALDASFIKVGTAFGEPLSDFGFLIEPLRLLAQEAQEAGTRVAIEPLPFSLIGSMPQGAELIEAVNHPAAGLVVDYWHVFRAGTSLETLSSTVPGEYIFGVELSDAMAASEGTLFEDTRDRRTLLTEGDQDVPGFINTIRHMGYSGPWGVEILSSQHRKLPLHDALVAAFDSAVRAFELADASI